MGAIRRSRRNGAVDRREMDGRSADDELVRGAAACQVGATRSGHFGSAPAWTNSLQSSCTFSW
jgi:hypothetical protein